MFIQVQLLNGFKRPLLYKVPADLVPEIRLHSVVNVPLRNKIYQALVTQIFTRLKQKPRFAIKEISGIDRFPSDTRYDSFISKLAHYSFTQPLNFYQRIRHFIDEKSTNHEEAFEAQQDLLSQLPTLTDEQQAVTQHVETFIKDSSFGVTLLHGVTGSGKTEVYKKLIVESIEAGKSVLLLLPEVSLSMQFEHLLKQQLPYITILGFHSASKPAEKRAVWSHLCDKKPLVIVGVHQPVFLPIANFGIIIVDEEHELGFQEKKHPKINSKEVALLRAQHYGIPILLGSATPAVSTIANVKRKGWAHFTLKKRFSGSFPLITKVPLISEDKKDKRQFFWITKELELAIADALSRKEQIIIYLNRRGYSFFTLCKSCGHTFSCQQCSVSLTPHIAENSQETILRCHYCDYHIKQPTQCPSCSSSSRNFLRRGIGTQQIVEILQELFPSAQIARADLDTTKKKKLWRTTVEKFGNGSIDILVGTKTISKGYHFPNVTLVGIIWADLNTHMPVYYAGESSLQQLIQVAGRTGRGKKASRVVMQVMQDHPIFDYIDEVTYPLFAQQELALRQQFSYPPFNRMLTIEIRHNNATTVEKDAFKIVKELKAKAKLENIAVRIMGPAVPVVSKVKNIEIRHITIKSPDFRQATLALRSIHTYAIQSSLFIVPSS